jgi:hypothetical protein
MKNELLDDSVHSNTMLHTFIQKANIPFLEEEFEALDLLLTIQ